MTKHHLPWLLLIQCMQGSISFAPGQRQRRTVRRRIPPIPLSIRMTITAAASEASAEASLSPAFDWEHQWYPIAPIRDLYTDRPNKITLLGRDYCVWCSTADVDVTSLQWNAFADVCPHRLVPLSEGRIEDNVLQCAYHGWEFGASGSCVRIPQLESTRQESQSLSAVTNTRACATSFPVRVKQELLWIFSSTNTTLAATRQPALIPQLDDRTMSTRLICLHATCPIPGMYSWKTCVTRLMFPLRIMNL